MLRKLLIVLHLAGVALSVALLVSTFAAKGMIVTKARETAVAKSRGISDPLAAKVEETLQRPVLGKLIRGGVRERLEAELSSYRSDPAAWLTGLAVGGAERVKAFDFPEIEHPLAQKAVGALKQGVSDLKGHLQQSYQDLIADLRLFAATNLVAFGIAAWLSWIARSPRSRHWLLAYSGLMLVVFVLSISAYFDQNWTWTVLTGNYMGWAYPVALGIFTIFEILCITPDLARRDPVVEFARS
jgi:hypothetical protein